MSLKYGEIIKQMSLEEKALMMSGKNTWETVDFEKYGIPSMAMSDGPHGLRRQAGAGDHLGLNASLPATCFPTAATIANSWDEKLGEEIGTALAEEAVTMDVNVILGPGLNIKRSPLCGRNFEYFSCMIRIFGKILKVIMKYSEAEIERIGRIGFETARKRNHRLCSVEKSNVLDTSRLWKKVMHRLAEEYTDVELTDMLVDNCAMQIVKNPAQFDVIVTENMFGDILSDEASMITGSIGMIPSSSLGATSCGLYEPIHGSAPDIAGQDLAKIQ